MPIEKRFETRTDSGVTLVENRYDNGLIEIGVYRDPVLGSSKILLAVISRTDPGNKWFVHADRNRAFWSRVKRHAVAFAVQYAEREIAKSEEVADHVHA